MNKTLKAADEVKKLHRMFQSLGEVVEVLDRIGSVEQAEQEVSARVERLNGEAAKLVTQINAASIEAQSIIDGAKLKHDEMIGEAASTVSEAKERAKKVLAEADAAAEQAVTTARETLQKAEVEALAAEGRRQVATDELAELEGKIAKAQAQINKLLGA